MPRLQIRSTPIGSQISSLRQVRDVVAGKMVRAFYGYRVIQSSQSVSVLFVREHQLEVITSSTVDRRVAFFRGLMVLHWRLGLGLNSRANPTTRYIKM